MGGASTHTLVHTNVMYVRGGVGGSVISTHHSVNRRLSTEGLLHVIPLTGHSEDRVCRGGQGGPGSR